jgi:RraA family protein
MGNVGCKIIRDFKRPNQKIVELFRNLPVANIDDCMNRIAAVDSMIKPFNKVKLLGIAFTVKVPEGDNLMFHKAIDMAQPGDVVMIDAGGDTNRSILGELMLTYCKKRNLAGVVVDGSVRDADALVKLDFPIYAKSVTPNGPYKNGPGEINTPISIGGKTVCPGDIIVGDGDGIVIIKPEDAEFIAAQTKKVSEKEHRIIETMFNEGTYIRPWVDEKLKEIGCEII